jgi:hypothetical protein
MDLFSGIFSGTTPQAPAIWSKSAHLKYSQSGQPLLTAHTTTAPTQASKRPENWIQANGAKSEGVLQPKKTPPKRGFFKRKINQAMCRVTRPAALKVDAVNE